jgi:hypothetical protein
MGQQYEYLWFCRKVSHVDDVGEVSPEPRGDDAARA